MLKRTVTQMQNMKNYSVRGIFNLPVNFGVKQCLGGTNFE